MMWHDMTALQLGREIAGGVIDPVDLAEHFLERIATLDAEGRIFIRLSEDRTRAEAQAARRRQRQGAGRGPLDGVPVSWKDLVDVACVETTMAARALEGRVPERDGVLLQRATQAGTVFLGKTNMTEFAFSGLGINTTHGTPANAHDTTVDRIPGGSSSGAGVAVARGLGPIAIGSDTGGSVRIPASLNGVVGLKTTIGALPMDGVMPLASLFDTIGPLTADVADAAAMWSVLSGRSMADLDGARITGKRLVAVASPMWRGIDEGIDHACRQALSRLEAAGADVEWQDVDEFAQAMDVAGRLITTDAWSRWSGVVSDRPDRIFPFMLPRFLSGKAQAGHEVLEILRELDSLAGRLHRRMGGCDALVAPTVRIGAPRIADLLDDEKAYREANAGMLANTTPGNLLKVCAVTLPCGKDASGMPAGLMLMQRPGREEALLRLAGAVEAAGTTQLPS
ncbi:MAG: amidase family protein [bacterium]|nr:amidase family protein [bacterium]